MLRFITNAPAEMVRNVAALGGKAEIEGSRMVLTVPDRLAISAVEFLAGEGYSVQPWRPRPAISDPTFAIAAAHIDRQGGSSSAPAAAFAR